MCSTVGGGFPFCNPISYLSNLNWAETAIVPKFPKEKPGDPVIAGSLLTPFMLVRSSFMFFRFCQEKNSFLLLAARKFFDWGPVTF